jgi:hypothetical protein
MLLIPALVGFEAISPTNYFTSTLTRWMLWSDPRTAALPFVLNGLNASETMADTKPKTVAPWLGALIVLGFVICLGVTFWFQYNFSANPADEWGRVEKPSIPFDTTARHISHLINRDSLSAAVSEGVWERLSAARPDGQMLSFVFAGIVVTALLALARLKFTWWPIHPILMVSMAQWEMIVIAPSILLGWAIRATVIGMGGASAYLKLKPLMVGVIAGELLSAIVWTLVAAIYYAVTGLTPPQFMVFQN